MASAILRWTCRLLAKKDKRGIPLVIWLVYISPLDFDEVGKFILLTLNDCISVAIAKLRTCCIFEEQHKLTEGNKSLTFSHSCRAWKFTELPLLTALKREARRLRKRTISFQKPNYFVGELMENDVLRWKLSRSQSERTDILKDPYILSTVAVHCSKRGHCGLLTKRIDM